MIEENVINWIDLGEAKQPLSIYGQKYKMNFFKLLKTMKSYNNYFASLDYIFQFFYLFQYLTLSLYGIYGYKEGDNYYLKNIYEYLSKVFLLSDIASDSLTYSILLIIIFILTVFFISVIIYLIICIKKDIKPLSIVLKLLNILIILEVYYLIGPIINTSLISIVCKKEKHIYLNQTCFKGVPHILALLASIICLIFHLSFSIILSMYLFDVGNVGEYGVQTRVNCSHEIYSNFAVIILFIAKFIFQFYLEQKKIYFVIWEIIIIFFCAIFTIYVFKNIFFYDEFKNFLVYSFPPIILWFSLMILIKLLINIHDTTIFQFVGICIILVAIYAYHKIKENYMISDFNIFDGKVLKDIEMFKYSLEKLTYDSGNYDNKILMHGYIHRFEEFLMSNPDLSSKYQKLKNDIFLNKKITQKSTISIYAIIYITYSYHIEKSIENNVDICINMCYFLFNKMKNPTYVIYLLSELKVKTHRQLYYKYLLMEQIKEYLINKINFSSNKESIKHVEIGSVILYNIYSTLFKLKIYDATSCQIEYFEIFKSSNTTKKSTENFLKSGEDILVCKNKISKIWTQLNKLNPFNSNAESDYMLYLKTIIQDDSLAKAEEKKNFSYKNKQMRYKNNTYYSMFSEDTSSFLLIDGALDANLKILYTTPNFGKLFLFSGKEMLNTSVNDLLPNVIQKHHKEFVDDAIKYSNFKHTFKNSIDVLVKTKNNGLINVNLYVKTVPNLSFGLNYMAYLNKNKEKNFVIVIDKDLKINGFTEDFGSGGNNDMENFIIKGNNFGLTQSIIGHHIGMVIPDILLFLEFDGEKNSFNLKKVDAELKGYLYPINPWKEIEHKVEYFLDKIKENSKNIKTNKGDDEEINMNLGQDYENIISDIKKKFPNPVSVFYRITVHTFLRNTFKYYRIYLTNNNSNINQITSKENSLSQIDEEDNFSKLNWKISSQTIEKKEGGNMKKMKEIKLSVISAKKKNENDEDDEDEEKKNEENKKEKKENDSRNNNLDLQIAGFHPDKKNQNVIQISSADEAKFNRIKTNIVQNSDTFIICYMKILNVLFAALTIFFVIYDSIINTNNIEKMDKFLTENLVFNHTKISSGRIYLEAVLYKYMREKYLDDNDCLSLPCRLVTRYGFEDGIMDLQNQKPLFTTFSKEEDQFSSKVKSMGNVTIFNLNRRDVVQCNMEFNLNLIINDCLKLIEFDQKLPANWTEALDYVLHADSNDTQLEIVQYINVSLNNLINQSLSFSRTTRNGFDQEEKKQKIKDSFNPFPISLVIMVIFIFLFIGVFFYFIYYLYTYEIFFVEKLIDFNNPKFEAYIKQLEEIKKKLRNENEDEEDEDKEDDLGFGTGMGSKKEEESKKNAKENKDKNAEDKKEKEELKKKRMRGKEKSKFQHQQKKKKNLMRHFFLKISVFFCLKIFILTFLGLTYYIFSTVIKSNTRSDYLEKEDITDRTEGIYKYSLDIHLSLMENLTKLIDFANLKIEFRNNGNATVEDKVYTDMETLIKENFPSITIQKIDEIDYPKLGNLLMPIISEAGNENDDSIASQFNQLYNADACTYLFKNRYDNGVSIQKCEAFWNGIIAKGMEQALTQMSVAISSVLDELKAVNNKDIEMADLKNLFLPNSYLLQFHFFMEYYFYEAYLKTATLFNSLRAEIVKSIKNKYIILLILYLIVSILLFFLIMLYIYSIRNNFNSFLYFIAIFPLKFLVEEDNLFKQILKLNEGMFR